MVHVKQLLHTWETLPAELQQEVVDFAEFLAQRRAGKQPLGPVSDEEIGRRRREGLGELKGKIWMADDFDAPLPDFAEY
ncbi:type II toxin-antitoxin system VapB family antitoxin [Hymenobacter metallilatus]|uniref:DUF2281 domain-containing protein n=1 Tax=Hymenobacter metallilatus TaxID=2493666 RepID=A0A428JK98_9BACT|nr:DUF2281 domain-containing protein [Hymenobacter metallilatus]RSK33203.1 DUF2281 domain-containing protein [Hymenobacter metallilatus]